jgi:hypothetical protein
MLNVISLWLRVITYRLIMSNPRQRYMLNVINFRLRSLLTSYPCPIPVSAVYSTLSQSGRGSSRTSYRSHLRQHCMLNVINFRPRSSLTSYPCPIPVSAVYSTLSQSGRGSSRTAYPRPILVSTIWSKSSHSG